MNDGVYFWSFVYLSSFIPRKKITFDCIKFVRKLGSEHTHRQLGDLICAMFCAKLARLYDKKESNIQETTK